jgi:nucleoside-diphosphate-sugar epimerase
MSAHVAITGATDFIGQNLIARLLAAGYKVHALTRHPRTDSTTVNWITGTLDNTAVLDKLVSGAAAIIHCAGQVRGSSLNDFLHTNLDGTANLVQVSVLQNPPPRFLLVSSLAAREPQLSWYADSKRRGEDHLIKHAGNLRWSIFRPTAVYGPGDRELAPLFRATRIGVLPMTGTRSARFGLLYVDDLIEAILCWLDSESPQQGVYELDDGTPGGYDHEAVKNIASGIWRHPVYSLPVPGSIIRLLASLNLGLARMLRYSPMLTPGKARELQHPDWVCDNTKLTGAYGWHPETRLQDGLRQSL